MGSFKANIKKFSLKKSKPNKKKKTIRKKLRKLKSAERKSRGMGKKRGGSTHANTNLQNKISKEIQEKIKENKQGIDTVNDEIAGIQNNIHEIEITKRELEQDTVSKEVEKTKIQGELDQANEKLTAALKDAEAMIGNYKEIEDQLKAKMNEIEGKSDAEIQQIISNFETELAGLEDKNAELQQKYTKQKEAADVEISQLQKQIESLKPQIQELEGDGGDGGVIADLKSDIDENANKLKLMTEELDKLNTEITQIKDIHDVNDLNKLETLQTNRTNEKLKKDKLKKLLEDKSKAIEEAIKKLKQHLNAILKCVFTDDSVTMENLADSTNLSKHCEKIEAYFRGNTTCDDVSILNYGDITTAYSTAVKALNDNDDSNSEKNKALLVEKLQSNLNLEYFKELIKLYYFFVCVLKDADKEEINTLATDAASLDKILGDIQSKLTLQQKKTDLNTKISELEEKNRQNQTALDKQKIELSNLQQLLAKAKSELQKAQKEADKAEEDLKKGQEKSEDEEKQLRKQQESNLADIEANKQKQINNATSAANNEKKEADLKAKQKAQEKAEAEFQKINNEIEIRTKELQESITKNKEAIQKANAVKTKLQANVTAKRADVELKTSLIPLLNQLNRQLRSMQVEEILIEDVIPKIERKDGENGSGDDDLPAKYAGDILVIKDVLHQVLNGNKSEDNDNNNNITVTIGNTKFKDKKSIADNLKTLFNFDKNNKTLEIDVDKITIQRGKTDVQYDDGDNPIEVLKSRIDSAKTEYEKLHASLETMKPIVMEDILNDATSNEQSKTAIQGLITQINDGLFKQTVKVELGDSGEAKTTNIGVVDATSDNIAKDLYILRFNTFIEAYIKSKNRLCDVITNASKDCGHNFREKISVLQFFRSVIDTLGIDASRFKVTIDGDDVTDEYQSNITEFLARYGDKDFKPSVESNLKSIQSKDLKNKMDIDPSLFKLNNKINIDLKGETNRSAYRTSGSVNIPNLGQTIQPVSVFMSILDNLKLNSESN